MLDDSELRKEKAIKSIRENYKQLEQSIVKQLFMSNDLHGTTTGTFREEIWKGLFEMVIPKKFVIEQSVFIIDANDGISHEVDLAIMDEMYTPYIFRYGKIKFIPIEAVAAVVECKSKSLKRKELQEWKESIASLKTSGGSIARMAASIATGAVDAQKSTRPICMLCAMEEPGTTIRALFDFTLQAQKNSKNREGIIRIDAQNPNKDLFAWYKELNFHKVDAENEDTWFNRAKKAPDDPKNIQNKNTIELLSKLTIDDYKVCDSNGKSISLLAFNFQLNQLLMLINNPLLFPHRDYVKLFNQKR